MYPSLTSAKHRMTRNMPCGLRESSNLATIKFIHDDINRPNKGDEPTMGLLALFRIAKSVKNITEVERIRSVAVETEAVKEVEGFVDVPMVGP